MHFSIYVDCSAAVEAQPDLRLFRTFHVEGEVELMNRIIGWISGS